MAEADPRQRYTANLQGEVDSAALYRTLSETEKNPNLAQVYARLGAVEEAHAEFWKRKIAAADQRVPRLQPSFRTRALAWLARRFGPAFVLPTINTLEQMDSGTYDAQPEAVAGGLPAAERSHARVIEALASPSPRAFSGPTIARLEGRHRGLGGNALRAAVLGANDGLCSNLSLVMGVAGADLAPHAILVTGLAGLLAGSCSMALGEWLSVSTTRESYQRQIKTEADELEQVPEEEQEELALIYQAKGLPEEQAKVLAQRLIANKETALDTLVGDRSRRTGWLGLGCRRNLLSAICGRSDFPGRALFCIGGPPGGYRQPCGKRRGTVFDRRWHDPFHWHRRVVFRNAAAADRLRRRRRDLWGRQADRRHRHGLIPKPVVRARNSARANSCWRVSRSATVSGRQGPPSSTLLLPSNLKR